MENKSYITWYPDKEKLSKHPATQQCYNKIKECFVQNYVGGSLSKPPFPKELEFLQWIKRFLNTMENNIMKPHTTPRFIAKETMKHCKQNNIKIGRNKNEQKPTHNRKV